MRLGGNWALLVHAALLPLVLVLRRSAGAWPLMLRVCRQHTHAQRARRVSQRQLQPACMVHARFSSAPALLVAQLAPLTIHALAAACPCPGGSSSAAKGPGAGLQPLLPLDSRCLAVLAHPFGLRGAGKPVIVCTVPAVVWVSLVGCWAAVSVGHFWPSASPAGSPQPAHAPPRAPWPPGGVCIAWCVLFSVPRPLCVPLAEFVPAPRRRAARSIHTTKDSHDTRNRQLGTQPTSCRSNARHISYWRHAGAHGASARQCRCAGSR